MNTNIKKTSRPWTRISHPGTFSNFRLICWLDWTEGHTKKTQLFACLSAQGKKKHSSRTKTLTCSDRNSHASHIQHHRLRYDPAPPYHVDQSSVTIVTISTNKNSRMGTHLIWTIQWPKPVMVRLGNYVPPL